MTAFPDLTTRLDQLAAALKRIGLPPGAKISAPENLEGDSFSCYFRFSRVGDLEQIIEILERRIEDGSIGEVVDLLNGPQEEE